MVVHELVHVIQAYPRSDAGWLVEGIADYARFYVFEPDAPLAAVDPDRATHRDGYRTTARFLDWCSGPATRKLVATLNRALARGRTRTTCSRPPRRRHSRPSGPSSSPTRRTSPRGRGSFRVARRHEATGQGVPAGGNFRSVRPALYVRRQAAPASAGSPSAMCCGTRTKQARPGGPGQRLVELGLAQGLRRLGERPPLVEGVAVEVRVAEPDVARLQTGFQVGGDLGIPRVVREDVSVRVLRPDERPRHEYREHRRECPERHPPPPEDPPRPIADSTRGIGVYTRTCRVPAHITTPAAQTSTRAAANGQRTYRRS